MTLNDSAAGETSTERSCATRAPLSLANPRRLRIGRDGRPLPLPRPDED